MRRAFDFVMRHWPWFALAASAALLAAAHAFETFGHLYPCTLCFKQREAHWAAAAIALAAAVLSFTPYRERSRMLILALLTLAYAYGTYLGFFHMGVEYHWWPGPTECASGGATSVSPEDMQALLRGARVRPPACDTAQWWFLGLSMAAWNGIICLGLLIASALATLRRRPA